MEHSPYVSTTNACKLCKPLGACLAFRGIEGAVPMLHGSQGCATYMRRYIISHFREPMDIASSSLGEKHAVYGGGPNLKQGLQNVMTKFGAKLIGVATTCLTETIGDDVPMIVREFRREMRDSGLPGPSRARDGIDSELLRNAHGRVPCRGEGRGRAALRGRECAQQPHAESAAGFSLTRGPSPPQGNHG